MSGSQNLRVLEAAPSGQMYRHQKRLIKRPHKSTMPTVVSAIQRTISPLNAVAVA